MIPDMTCKQGPHVRTRPQTFRVPVSCIPFNSISGRHTPARNREAQSQTTAAYDRKEGLRHAHEKKNAVQCGVDVARGRKSHAGRYTCCTMLRCQAGRTHPSSPPTDESSRPPWSVHVWGMSTARYKETYWMGACVGMRFTSSPLDPQFVKSCQITIFFKSRPWSNS